MILHVDSLDDDRVDAYRHVGESEWLRSRNLFVAEGRLVVERLLATGYDIDSVLVSPAALDALATSLESIDRPVYVAAPPLFNRIAGFNVHRGCLAIAHRPAPSDVEQMTAGAGLLLGLEGVGNPDNVGGLFRTAWAFGVDAILLDRASGDPFYRKALRTSMGAVLRVPFARLPDWRGDRARLRASGIAVVALTTQRGAATLEHFASRLRTSDRLLLIVGSEGAGLGPESLAETDALVRIPMAAGVDSLNVTVAAGIALARVTAARAV